MARAKRKQASQHVLQPAMQRALVLATTLVGLAALAVGIYTSLLFGLIGAFLVAGSTASRFEGRVERSRQTVLMLAIFLVLALLAWFLLGVREFSQRSCIPEGDCQGRHQFNSLEILDQHIFHIYGQDNVR